MVAVTALVPYEKQWEEYERALASATGYSPMQDVPRYLFYVAERAEVSEDPNAPLQWQTVSNSSFAMDWAKNNYAGVAPEVADEAYLVPFILTMPIPPLLMKPYDSLALHSEIPVKRLSMNPAMPQPGAGENPKEEGKPEAGAAPKPEADFSEGLPQIPAAGAGAAGGYGMMPGMAPGMGYPAGGASDMGSAAGSGMYGGYGGMPGMEWRDLGAIPVRCPVCRAAMEWKAAAMGSPGCPE